MNIIQKWVNKYSLKFHIALFCNDWCLKKMIRGVTVNSCSVQSSFWFNFCRRASIKDILPEIFPTTLGEICFRFVFRTIIAVSEYYLEKNRTKLHPTNVIKVNNINVRKEYKICLKLMIKLEMYCRKHELTTKVNIRSFCSQKWTQLNSIKIFLPSI